jgi:hypothetical protein
VEGSDVGGSKDKPRVRANKHCGAGMGAFVVDLKTTVCYFLRGCNSRFCVRKDLLSLSLILKLIDNGERNKSRQTFGGN